MTHHRHLTLNYVNNFSKKCHLLKKLAFTKSTGMILTKIWFFCTLRFLWFHGFYEVCDNFISFEEKLENDDKCIVKTKMSLNENGRDMEWPLNKAAQAKQENTCKKMKWSWDTHDLSLLLKSCFAHHGVGHSTACSRASELYCK